MSDYTVTLATPLPHDYRRLRSVAGLTPRSTEATAAGLPNTFIGVVVEQDGRPIGMGRIIGDGALFFQVVDVAVEPEHQGKGLGKRIMGALIDELRRRVTAEAYVSLIADGEAHKLYRQFGFELTAPASVGMAMWLR
jgi:GNAT superfamily N-acetyltransferase